MERRASGPKLQSFCLPWNSPRQAGVQCFKTRACRRGKIPMGFSTAGGGSFSTGPKMNVTPMIDVLLVRIIVFMVVVIEQKPTGLQTEIPQQANPKDHTIPPPNATIVIQIHHSKSRAEHSEVGRSQLEQAQDEHPQVMVNEEAVEWGHLGDRLRDIFAIRVERIAYLKADDDID